MAEHGVLALIPARSGSKTVVDKNIRIVGGKPLLSWSIEHALASRHVTRVIVSTDSAEYARLAREWGAETPFLRPAELAGDLTPDLDVFRHALTWLAQQENYCPELCVHLRPTSPMRVVTDIDAMIDFLRAHPEFSAARTVSEVLHPPFKMWYRLEDGTLRPVVPGRPGLVEPWNEPRQKLAATFIQTADIDVVRTDTILSQHSMTGDRVYGYLVNSFCDIDTSAELERASQLLAGRRFARESAGKSAATRTRQTFCFDVDGVIATLTPDNDYRKAGPIVDTIAVITALFRAGHRIVLSTARGSATGLDWQEVTRAQLAAWCVPFHELHFGKPAADYYIDDRMLSPRDLRYFLSDG